MQSTTAPHRLFDRLSLAFMVLVVALPITYLEVVQPSRQQLTNTANMITNMLPHVAPASSSPENASAPTASAVSAAQASATAAIRAATPKTAITNSYVHLRIAKSVNSTVITNIISGTTVQLRDDADPTWQGVTYQGKTGYIYRAYLQY